LIFKKKGVCMIIKSIRSNGTVRVQTDTSCDDNGVETPDMAQQQYKDSSDINCIMKKYEATGLLSHIRQNAEAGRYAELGEPTDLMEAMTRVDNARKSFMDLPASLRAKCNHEPAKFLEMLKDGSNDEELYQLGIKVRPGNVVSESGKPDPKANDSAPGSVKS